MKYYKDTSKSWPRLVIDKVEHAANDTGFLHLSQSSERIPIGNVLSSDFLLIQCLFSPQNFPTAKYSPVTQTYERVFNLIKKSKDIPSPQGVTTEEEITSMVRASVGSIQKREVGSHITFILHENKIRMEITK